MHECMSWVQQRSGQWVFRIIKCKHGCCGDVFDQECCSAAVVKVIQDSHVWQTVAAVTAGLLVLTLFIILIVCAAKKNTTRERRICSGNRGARGRSNETFSGLEVSPSPCTETQCNIFILNGNCLNEGRATTGDNTGSTSVSSHPSDPPPAYSSTD